MSDAEFNVYREWYSTITSNLKVDVDLIGMYRSVLKCRIADFSFIGIYILLYRTFFFYHI